MKSRFKNMDKLLFLLMVLYTIFGLVMIFSASSMTAVLQYGASESHFFTRQLFYVVCAYIVGFFILFLPNKFINLLKKSYKLIALVAIVLLVTTFFGGVTINGAKSWLRLGPVQLQTSEFVKTMTILFIAFAFSNPKKMFSKYRFLIPFSFTIVCFLFIIEQPDLGTAIIYAITVFLMFLSLPLKDSNFKKLKIIGGVCVILCGCLFFFGSDLLKNVLTKEQLSRLIYTHPCARYIEKTGYQVCNGYIAINNGGLFGLGLGNSTQKYLYLPEAYTDFIFPIIVEELGSVGGSLIIIGFMVILFCIFKIAKNAETLTGSLIAYGTFCLMLSHLMINLLGVLAIIPLTGVPLPFLSNGGSFAFNLIILLFMTERVNIESKKIKLKREISRL